MEIPNLKAPPDACDCHIHVYDDRYPVVPTASFRPQHAPAAAYRDVQRALGLSRVVVVQPTAYGFDNTCTLEAMASLGPNTRGVAIVPVDVSDAELERLTRAGIRGIRFFMLPGGLLQWDALESLANRVLPFGWHVQLQLDGRELPDHEARLKKLPGELVIDHNGKFLEPVSPDDPAFRVLLRLLDTGRCWVKLSAPYETSKSGPPLYQDVSILARTLVQANRERCMWATNWPHPNQNSAPSTAAMLDMLLMWADDEATRGEILVDNPAKLYGF